MVGLEKLRILIEIQEHITGRLIIQLIIMELMLILETMLNSQRYIKVRRVI